MLVNDIGSLDYCLTRGYRTIGLNLKNETVVVGVLTNAARLNSLCATTNRRETRIDVNDANRIIIALVVITGNIATTSTNTQRHGEVMTLPKRANNLIGVNKDKLSRNIEISTANGARTIDVNACYSLIAGAHSLKNKLFNVKHNIGNVLVDAIDS